MEMTLSPSARRMPRTPVESRPANTRTSSTAKRMQRPRAVVSRMSFCCALHTPTPTMESPSSSFIAILPLRLMPTKSLSLLRRTPPERVANITSYCSQVASSSGKGRIEVMLSPGSIGSRLTKALPREVGVPTGRRQTLSW